jgi:diguanylate cyclase (GGDEF)-like protein
MSIIQKATRGYHLANLGLALMRQRSCVGRLLPNDYKQRLIVTLNVTENGISIGRRSLGSHFLKAARIFQEEKDKQSLLVKKLSVNISGVAKRLNDLGVTKIRIAGNLSRWQINYAIKEFLNDPNIVKRDPYLARLRGFEVSLEEGVLIIESLKREILEFESHQDVLRIFNSKYFLNKFPLEVLEAQKYGKKLSLIMIDIDFFKNVNDTFGHQFGDEVLKKIAETIKKKLREADIFCRIGGEEFVIIVKEAGIEIASNLAKKINEAIAEMQLEFFEQISEDEIPEELKGKVIIEGGKCFVSVTISLGVSSLEPGDTHEKFLKRADDALYKVKNGGRNGIGV